MDDSLRLGVCWWQIMCFRISWNVDAECSNMLVLDELSQVRMIQEKFIKSRYAYYKLWMFLLHTAS